MFKRNGCGSVLRRRKSSAETKDRRRDERQQVSMEEWKTGWGAQHGHTASSTAWKNSVKEKKIVSRDKRQEVRQKTAGGHGRMEDRRPAQHGRTVSSAAWKNNSGRTTVSRRRKASAATKDRRQAWKDGRQEASTAWKNGVECSMHGSHHARS